MPTCISCAGLAKAEDVLIKLGCLVQIINLDRDVNDPRHVFFLFKIQRRSDVGGRDRAREIPVHSFEHLVGSNKQLIGHSEAEHPGGRGVDDQFISTPALPANPPASHP
jgi:hypothetical protein